MTPTTPPSRISIVALSLLASAAAFGQVERRGRDEPVVSTTPNRGILEGISLERFGNLQLVEEEVPADAPTIVLLDDAAKSRGRASSHFLEAFVYANFSPGRNNQTALFFNWATTSGGSGDPDCPGARNDGCFAPMQTVPGIFHADGAIFRNGFKAGETAVSSYEIFAYRDASDPDTQDLAFVEMELWDGDPLNAFDSTGVGTCSGTSLAGRLGETCDDDADCQTSICSGGPREGWFCTSDAVCPLATCVLDPGTGACGVHFSAAPIPGTKVTFSDVPVNTKIVFRGELDPPVVTPHGRVWVVVTSDACRFGWLLSKNSPKVGSDDSVRLNALTGSTTGAFEFQLDTDGATNGLGVCCGDDCDGAACDLSVGLACCDDPTGSRNQCVDGDAEDAQLATLGGTCSGHPLATGDNCSNFWLNIYAGANVTMTLQPTGNGALGALADGARIEGNEIIMVAGGEHVLLDIQIGNFDTSTELFCVGGNFPGAPCTAATELEDCGPLDPEGEQGSPNFGCGIKLRAWQAELESSGYGSGMVGELTNANVPCSTNSDCVAALGGACDTSPTGDACTEDATCPLATSGERCVGPYCWQGRCEFIFINTKRGDYIFKGLPDLAAVDPDGPDFRWGSALRTPLAIRPPDPFPVGGLNGAQLIVTTSADAKGTFTVNLKPSPLSLLLDAQSGLIPLVSFVPAKITVSTGQCCNLGADPFVCMTDQVTAAGCAQLGANNGFAVRFNPTRTCADDCCTCALDEDCDDGDSCTNDLCVACACESTLVASDGTECLDGTGPTCVRTTIDDGDQCTDSVCSDAGVRGVATHTASEAGTTCSDGTPCTLGDVCDGTNSDANGGCFGRPVSTFVCVAEGHCPFDPFGNRFPCVGGSCFCTTTPDAGFGVSGGTAGTDPITGDPIICTDVGEKIIVNIELGPSANIVNGGQFIVNWDPTCLDFQGITVAPPYTTVLSEVVGAGSLFWAVGIDPFNLPATRGSNFGNLSFIKLPGCDGCVVCLDGSNPQNLVLVDDNGDPVNVNPSCSPSIRPVPNVTINVPDSAKVNTDCDSNTAVVAWVAPSSTGDCAGTHIKCTGIHLDSGTDLSGIALTGGLIPLGTSIFTCSGSSDRGCSSSADKSWTIEVNDQTTLDVLVQLSPTINDEVMTRGIEFELFSDCIQPALTFTHDMVFGSIFDFLPHFTISVKTPASGRFVCITARDRLHTLRAVDYLSCADGVYSAVFKGDPFFGGNWLIGGNLDAWKGPAGIPGGNPDVIDILDFGQFVAGFGTCPGADTPGGTAGPHADINGDGCVDTLDFSFIDRHFLSVSKDSCCPGGNAAGLIAVTELSVRELRARGLGDLTVADINGDGMVNQADMAAFAAGEMPTTKVPARQDAGLRSRR